MKVVDGIKINDGTIYYTENENATTDLKTKIMTGKRNNKYGNSKKNI